MIDKTIIEEFQCVCYLGDINAVIKMVNNVQEPNILDMLNMGLSGACSGGHRNIVDFLIKLGSDYDVQLDWCTGLRGAREEGHKEIARFMESKYRDFRHERRNNAKFVNRLCLDLLNKQYEEMSILLDTMLNEQDIVMNEQDEKFKEINKRIQKMNSKLDIFVP